MKIIIRVLASFFWHRCQSSLAGTEVSNNSRIICSFIHPNRHYFLLHDVSLVCFAVDDPAEESRASLFVQALNASFLLLSRDKRNQGERMNQNL